MKKFIFSLVTVLCCSMTLWTPAMAQMPDMPPLPMDPNVRYGKLENGLTYYI